MNNIYTCVYCGNSKPLQEFLYKKKSGFYSQTEFKCKLCSNTMKKRTLTTPMNIEEWCKWLYFNIRNSKYGSEVYQKINWKLLTTNLKKMGIAVIFWETWRNIKEEYSSIDVKTIEKFFEELYKTKELNTTLGDFIK